MDVNPLTTLGWVVSAILVVVAGFLIYLIVVGAVRGIKQSHRDAKLKKMDLETYLREAKQVARQTFIDEFDPFNQDQRNAFLQGARWAWGAHRRKR